MGAFLSGHIPFRQGFLFSRSPGDSISCGHACQRTTPPYYIQEPRQLAVFLPTPFRVSNCLIVSGKNENVYKFFRYVKDRFGLYPVKPDRIIVFMIFPFREFLTFLPGCPCQEVFRSYRGYFILRSQTQDCRYKDGKGPLCSSAQEDTSGSSHLAT